MKMARMSLFKMLPLKIPPLLMPFWVVLKVFSELYGMEQKPEENMLPTGLKMELMQLDLWLVLVFIFIIKI